MRYVPVFHLQRTIDSPYQEDMKILHLVSSLRIGGAERFVLDLCREQQRHGLQPAVVSFGSGADPLVAECEAGGIPLMQIEGGLLARQRALIPLLRQYQTIHVHSPSALRASALAIRVCGRKVVYTRHGAAPLKRLRWQIPHRLARRAVGMVTFVSGEGRENFFSTYRWHNKPDRVISNGIDVQDLVSGVPPVPVSLDRVRLGVVGRLVPLKSQISLLEVLAGLPAELRRMLEVNIFGEGECREELETYARSKLGDLAVNFHGIVTDRKKVYAAMDVLVMTSRTEGLSLAIIEAMAAGRPVIATRVGDTALLVNEQTGWTFEYGAWERLHEILTTILAQPACLAEKGRQAQSHVVDNFSMLKVHQDYLQAYQETA